jgi:uncharacterized LabA/DUF88 family protein
VTRRVNVYVDGFNLYYGSLRGTRERWLDLVQLAQVLLPKEQIHRVRYFSATVSGARDPDAPVHQGLYLRALRTRPEVTIHLGTFLASDRSMPLAPVPPAGGRSGHVYLRPGGPQSAWVTRTEEKGSDVNLATWLLTDGFDGDYDMAVVVSNDSDLTEPIRVARQRFGVVGVVCPHAVPSRTLKSAASWQVKLFRSPLRQSQFPSILTDGSGTFTKPPNW